MYLQLSSKLIYVALVIVAGFLLGTSIKGQSYCNPASSIAPELKNRPVDPADGRIHVTYRLTDPNISTNSQNAILNAIGQWNAVSSTTNVVFEAAAPGAIADLEFNPSSNGPLTLGCAAYDSHSNTFSNTLC